MQTIVLAGGCFWGIQKYMDQFEGIVKTRVGYANGTLENPSYEQVKTGQTGHAESCEIVFDETKISLSELLDRYFDVIDPTSLNKQGLDIGTQYRVGIFTNDPDQIALAKQKLETLQTKYDQPLVVECTGLTCFYEAEEYHQKYLDKNPGGYCHIDRCFFNLKS